MAVWVAWHDGVVVVAMAVVMTVVMATVNVALTVPPNPAQFKNRENTIASASSPPLRC